MYGVVLYPARHRALSHLLDFLLVIADGDAMKGQEIVRACLLFIRNFFIYSWQTPESVSVYVCWRPFANLGGSSVCVSVHD